MRSIALWRQNPKDTPMMKISVRSFLSSRVLSGAVALLMASIFAQRADATSPINPGMVGAGKAVTNGLTIEVRGGHGGSGGGGGRGWGGGHSVGGVSGAAVRGGTFGTAPAAARSPRFAGRAFVHRRHFGGAFVGGVYYDDYPYDDPDYYDYPPVYPAFVAGGGCRRVLTVHGPRVVCHHRAARRYRVHRRRHHRRHHHA
jgi:hypothetical protein